MTKKRFTVECDDADIWEDNQFLAVAYDHHNALKFAERLNEIADENVQLKKCNSKAKNHIEDIIFLLNNTPSQTLSREDLITLVQKTKEYLE